VIGQYKLLNEVDNLVAYDINTKEYSNPNVCPHKSIRLCNMTGDYICSKVHNTYLYPIAEVLAPVKALDWNFIYSILTVTTEMANASTAFI